MQTNISKRSWLPHWSHQHYTKYVAPLYDFLTSLTGWRVQLSKHALSNLPKGRLLDLGCGTGYFLNMAKENGFEIMGVEPSKGMAEIAKQKYQLDESIIKQTTADQLSHSNGSPIMRRQLLKWSHPLGNLVLTMNLT